MSGSAIMLGIILVVSYVAIMTEFAPTYGQTEGKIHLQSIPTDKDHVNVNVVKEQWLREFNQLLSESHYVSDENN
jgi:heme/copper-type cytochrome/quinol oxidase subunit 2